MDSVTSTYTTRELRAELADIVGRASYGHERVAITRNGRLAAVVIGPDDLELLERLEEADDLRAYHEAVAEDDGGRVTLEELRRELDR